MRKQYCVFPQLDVLYSVVTFLYPTEGKNSRHIILEIFNIGCHAIGVLTIRQQLNAPSYNRKEKWKL